MSDEATHEILCNYCGCANIRKLFWDASQEICHVLLCSGCNNEMKVTLATNGEVVRTSLCAKIARKLESVPEEATPDGKPISALSVQQGGDHYKKLKIQPIEYIHANGIPFAEGSVIKYVTRWRDKNGIADLEKAKHFIELLIELETKAAEGKTPDPT